MFHAVDNLCTVDLSLLNLPVSDGEALELLAPLGFRVIKVNLVRLARSLIGIASYRRGACLADAPNVFDCSSFVKWLYAKRGLWLPRRTIQQIELGTAIELPAMTAGDAIFTTGRNNYYRDDPAQGVGHVGLATGEGTVVHAANSRVKIVENKIDDFLRKEELRGIRRYVPNPDRSVTLKTPLSREVEVSDDIRWIVLQQLAKK